MSMYFKKENETENLINILPMIDIIFAILSFFIISSLYLTKVDSIKVNLPKSSSAESVQNKIQIITVDKNEKIYFQSNEISSKNIYLSIQKYIEKMENPLVILRADDSLNYGFIINILDELRKIENLRIGIETDNE
ncbi:Biopolymer transport protein ExbD/TolR [Prochlorococcus marinus str. MIT 9201]|uniref:Biopolymer transport protein ExbD/TolR n=2 Tax=Prochlorococcus marinus TaxID=1219 RepID=A0A0A2A669_PROMR|nr:biopolymer transporter ExbD [Prochlorococcus marinus]KGF96341.1 Biopolymer transport protein ExbD/TolR [Prochlorococcus marinus str. MIT 9201]